MSKPLKSIKDDKLDREKFLDKIFNFFNTFGDQNNHGLSILINGKYGSGKTSIFNFIIEKNLKENTENNFNVIYLDVWKWSYFHDPIIPFIYSLNDYFKNSDWKKYLKSTSVFLLNNLTKINITAFEKKEINSFNEYEKITKKIDEFRKKLKKICSKKKIIFLIDELDRCLPNYQIKVLESIYHILDIPNLLVVIAMDKDQLEHSIRNIFGTSIDAYSYLSKFIRYYLDIPNDKNNEFARSLLKIESKYFNKIDVDCILNILKESKIGLRDLKIIFQKFNIVFNEVCKKKNDFQNFYFGSVPIFFMVLLKHMDDKLYSNYFLRFHEENIFEKSKIDFSRSKYFIFLNEASKSSFQPVLNSVRKFYFRRVELEILSLFSDSGLIDSDQLVNNIKVSINEINSWKESLKLSINYETIKEIIKLVNNLI